ncbi:MAG: hypothetical protein R3F56_13855 [Planctomycetota bacterium]
MNAFPLVAPCLLAVAACSSLDGVESHGARSLHGRLGGLLVAEFDVGRSTCSYDVPSGVLTADVTRVTNDQRRRRVLAMVEFNNRSDDPLHIAVADVFLQVDGQRRGAKLSQDLEMPPLRPRTRQTVEFAFDLDAVAPTAVYPMSIDSVYPFRRPFELAVRVPGLPPAATPASPPREH